MLAITLALALSCVLALQQAPLGVGIRVPVVIGPTRDDGLRCGRPGKHPSPAPGDSMGPPCCILIPFGSGNCVLVRHPPCIYVAREAQPDVR